VHATANVLHAASVWGIRRLIFVSVGGARPGDPDPYLDARGKRKRWVRGSDRSWTVFRPAPWFDLRDGTPRVSTEVPGGVGWAIAESVRRQDTVGRVYEDASTDRFRGGNSREGVPPGPGDPVDPPGQVVGYRRDPSDMKVLPFHPGVPETSWNVRPFLFLFLSVVLLSLGGGCATLPKVSDAIDNAATQEPPQILSAKGLLSPEKSKALMERLKRSVARRTCWNAIAPSSNR